MRIVSCAEVMEIIIIHPVVLVNRTNRASERERINWILTYCQQHRVTSRQTQEIEAKMVEKETHTHTDKCMHTHTHTHTNKHMQTHTHTSFSTESPLSISWFDKSRISYGAICRL